DLASDDTWICNICRSSIKRCGGTSSFVKHLKNCHSITTTNSENSGISVEGGGCNVQQTKLSGENNLSCIFVSKVARFGYNQPCTNATAKGLDENMVDIWKMIASAEDFLSTSQSETTELGSAPPSKKKNKSASISESETDDDEPVETVESGTSLCYNVGAILQHMTSYRSAAYTGLQWTFMIDQSGLE
uniref:BED-type domain-containing protein n=1 Tax=Romanomermis culicivorax TaxID=13658 RepID=A0A915IYS5_ROMCU